MQKLNKYTHFAQIQYTNLKAVIMMRNIYNNRKKYINNNA